MKIRSVHLALLKDIGLIYTEVSAHSKDPQVITVCGDRISIEFTR